MYLKHVRICPLNRRAALAVGTSILCAAAAAVVFSPSAAIAGAHRCDPIVSAHDPVCRPRPIDLVICLDTSSSMDGLIDSARARLWDIVNSLASARPTPHLRVGLITYGSPNNSTGSNGWLVKQTDLTSDLDSVYARMMGMRTNGGDEYVGWALRRAIDWMQWSPDPSALKMIFIAGNESADQASDTFNFRYVAEDARSRGISINAIYCGETQAGINERWNQVPTCGGSFAAIDMQRGTIQMATPHDKALLELNLKLNATYVPYGDAGVAGYERQKEQDAAAEGLGQAVLASRAAAKATAQYRNAHWDLVDSVQQGQVALKDVPEAALPAEMKQQSVAEREAFVQGKVRARAEVQARIAEVSAAREKFLRDAREKSANGQQSLDEAVLASIRSQAEAKGFKFDK